MTITRLSGGLTPGDGANPRTFPAIWNPTADTIEAQGSAIVSQGSAIADLEGLNPVQFGTAVASGGQVLAFSTAVSGYEPVDVFSEAVNGTPVYRYVDTVYFTSSGTFSKGDYPWLRAIRVKLVGGGGGGGGCLTTAASQSAVAASGGGAAYAESFITDISGLDASVTVTQGAGGAGGAAGGNNGSAGGTSSFGSLVSAVGGGGGGAAGPVTVSATGAISVGASTGGDSASCVGDLTISGSGCQIPWGFQAFATTVFSPTPGSSILGFARVSSSGTGFNGGAGTVWGSGGNGGANGPSQATQRSGGAGGNGIVIVELYA